MEKNYKDKDGKLVQNIHERWYNQYNEMLPKLGSLYKGDLDNLHLEESDLLKVLIEHEKNSKTP
jgi:hypothetical protein